MARPAALVRGPARARLALLAAAVVLQLAGAAAGQANGVSQGKAKAPLPTLGFAPGSRVVCVDEGVSTVVLSVQLSAAAAARVAVSYRASVGNATGRGKAVDYMLTKGKLTFAAGETLKTITVTILDDTRQEGAESFSVLLSAPKKAKLSVDKKAVVTIFDKGMLPNVRFAPESTSLSVQESAGTATLTVQLSAAAAAACPVKVDYAATAGTATGGGVDYTLASGTLTFAAGETSKTIPVTIVDDALTESGEAFTVTLSSPTGATLNAAAGTATVTILANDAPPPPPPPSVGFAAVSLSVQESAGTATLTVHLSSAAAGAATVDYTATAGTATTGDFTLAPGTLTFAAGETSKTIPVAIVDDAIIEEDENVTVTLSNPTGATLGAGASTATVTILNDDYLLIMSRRMLVMTEGDSDYSLYISLAFQPTADVSVDLISSNPQALDKFQVALRFTPANWGTPQEVGLFSFNNDAVNGNKTVVISPSVTSSDPRYNGAADPGVGVLIIDDDQFPPRAGFVKTSVSVKEGATSVSLAVRLYGVAATPVTADYATTPGTATAPGDYTPASGTLTFTQAAYSQEVRIDLVDDLLLEGGESFSVVLSNPNGAPIAAGADKATVTIVDNEVPPPTVSFASASKLLSVQEGGNGATLTVQLSAAAAGAVSVDFATAAGTATSPSDYVTIGGRVTFAAGETSKTIFVPLIADLLPELSESFSVALSNPIGATLDAAASAATVTILDDDAPPPSVGFAPEFTFFSVQESAGTAALTVQLSAAAATPVTVNYNAASGTATVPGDFTLAPGTLAFAAGETSKEIRISIVDDALVEGGEQFSVSLVNPTGAKIAAGADKATVTIMDDDIPPPSVGFALEFTALTVQESVGTAALTVQLSAAAGKPVTVDYAATPGTATTPGDFTLAPGTLTFAAGETSQEIRITIVDDALPELAEAFSVVLSNPTSATIAAGVGASTVTILDNDGAQGFQ